MLIIRSRGREGGRGRERESLFKNYIFTKLIESILSILHTFLIFNISLRKIKNN